MSGLLKSVKSLFIKQSDEDSSSVAAEDVQVSSDDASPQLVLTYTIGDERYRWFDDQLIDFFEKYLDSMKDAGVITTYSLNKKRSSDIELQPIECFIQSNASRFVSGWNLDTCYDAWIGFGRTVYHTYFGGLCRESAKERFSKRLDMYGITTRSAIMDRRYRYVVFTEDGLKRWKSSIDDSQRVSSNEI